MVSFAPELADANSGFQADYFGQLAAREAGHFWFRSRNRLVCWALRRYFPAMQTFLEVGCGTGFVLSGIRREFPELRLHGSEIFSDGLAFAGQRLPGVALFQMDARRIPFADEFDVIGAFDVLEHVEDDAAVLQQMFQAVTPGGGIVLTVPQHRWLWSAVDDYSFHKRRYGRDALLEKIQRAGFQVLRVTSFVFLLLPMLLLSRLWRVGSSAGSDPLAEYKIPSWVNTVFESALDLERCLIATGLSLPAGGSLLVVARRGRR
ncbi:MAG: methyltransferase [Nitrospirae bacterium RIFCSPLOWO2_01_FULL_62_17]|nr:MAG: methyltransferase [Nitrospirae bacterium RIFCSPLOWO2_01_FULL_62_17]